MRLLIFILILIELASTKEIHVCPDNKTTNSTGGGSYLAKTNCSYNFTDAIKSIENDIAIILTEPGNYWLEEFKMIENVSNISIYGLDDMCGDYYIQCSRNVGLAFLQVEMLQLENIHINGCGISSNNTKIMSDKINETIDMLYSIPAEIGYGITIVGCTNIMIKNITVNNTQGIGILAINVAGDSKFDDLTLINNQSPLCYLKEDQSDKNLSTIGGGIYILYMDYRYNYLDLPPNETNSLSITNLYAYNNRYCTLINEVNVIGFGTPTARTKLGYTVGSAGGLGVTLTQLDYTVDVSIMSSIFKNNTGIQASGAAFTMFSGIKGSKISIDNCSFVNNGFEDHKYAPLRGATANAGLVLYKNLKHASNPFPDDQNYSVFEINNSTFAGNKAEICANIALWLFEKWSAIETYKSEVIINDTVISDNSGAIAPALCASVVDSAALFSQVSVKLSSITVSNNIVHSAHGSTQSNLADSSGQMFFQDINVEFDGSSNITNNTGAPIICVSSNLYFSGKIRFYRNSANFGGAMQVLQHSHIVLKNFTELEFNENFALFSGGGIYRNYFQPFATLYSGRKCLLYFEKIDAVCNISSTCVNISELNFNVTFKNNTAHYGSSIFGTTLSDCSWYYDLLHKNNKIVGNDTGLELLLSLYPDKFHFDNSTVNTEAVKLVIEDGSLNRDAYPGERIYLNISAYDSFGFRANSLLLSSSDDPVKMNSTLTQGIYWFIHSSDPNGTKVPLDIVGIQEANGRIDIFSSDSPALVTVNITLMTCGVGFSYDNDTKTCKCDIDDYNSAVSCNVQDQTITVDSDHWFGPVPQLDNLTLVKKCFYDLCKLHSTTFRPDHFDSQCNNHYNRTGLLCSNCDKGTSVIFASNRCKKCSNTNLFWIPIFAVAGIIIVFIIAYFNITVADGYINGFIFYCNCLNYFIPYLEPSGVHRVESKDYVFILISWVNLDIGIESCFYDGMTELDKVGLRYIFPIYLYLLVFLIIILAKKSKFFSKFSISAGRTFATLFILTYFSIFATSISLMGFVRFQAVDPVTGESHSYYGWIGDVSQEYGKGKHALLLFVAVLITVVYVIPIPLLLLFPSLIYRFPYSSFKLKPILDAFWNPFTAKRRFWLGARALFRVIPFTLAMYIRYPENVFWFGTTIVVMWYTQGCLMPYNGSLTNALDSFFILNMAVILFGNIYCEHFTEKPVPKVDQYEMILYIALSLAYIAFGFIIVIHLRRRFPYRLVNIKTVLQRIRRNEDFRLKETQAESVVSAPKMTTVIDSIEESDNVDTVLKAPNFAEFREPLIDGSEISYRSLNIQKDLN